MKCFRAKQSQLLLRFLLTAALTVLPFFVTTSVHAQEDAAQLDVSAADRLAATYTVSHFRYHITAANTPAGRAALAAHNMGTPFTRTRTALPAPATTIPAVPAPGFYGEDLVNFGGKVVTTAKSHPVYVNMASCGGTVAACWGNPVAFINDLSNSTFIQLVNQYIGVTTTNRYPAGTTASVTIPLFLSNVISVNDILTVLHASAKTSGTGYTHIYHVFLPKGADTCFDLSSICYSPDNPATFAFCAYHASVDYGDIGHVVFTVLPFANVQGCGAATPNPNSPLIDSTNSSLSHELIEAITDPDGLTWMSGTSAVDFGFEIADLCQPLADINGFALDPTLTLNGKKYELQLEYSNKYHACAGAP